MDQQKIRIYSSLPLQLKRRELFTTIGTFSLAGIALSHLESSPVHAAPRPGIAHLHAQGEQSNWRWCNKCQGLFFGGGSTQGVCPAWGQHDSGGSGNYVLVGDVSSAPGQHSWRWCNKCQGLFFAGHAYQGRCPAGQAHSSSGSADYALQASGSGNGGQDNWRWCNKCEGLFFAASFNQGFCPAWDAHDSTGSGNYMLKHL